MKVLMQSRSNFFTMPGGDTMQLLKTKEQLELLGVQVDICLENEPDLTGYDIVHLSNITRVQETYIQTKNAKKQGKPVVLSTIFWPMEEFEKNGQTGVRKILNKCFEIDNIERIKAVARYIKDKSARNEATLNLLKIGYTKMQQYVVKNTDVYLPNAELEMKEVRKTFSVTGDNYVVVPNGIDRSIAEKYLNEYVGDEYRQYENAVICVGRIETRKNQLALVKALDGTDYKLVLVGAVSDNHREYYEEICKYLKRNANFTHIERIPNEELYKIYRMCKVSVLPSWLDTPGLVSLEAAAMGCNLAVSSRGTTTEYFGRDVFYCEPDDIESIKRAVDNAFNAQSNKSLQNKVMENFTWEKAAEKTLEGYKLAVNT